MCGGEALGGYISKVKGGIALTKGGDAESAGGAALGETDSRVRVRCHSTALEEHVSAATL